RLIKLLATAAARKQVAVAIERHDDRRMTEQRLSLFRRQLAPALALRVDAPRGEEMPERVQRVFRLAGLGHHARRLHHPLDIFKHVLVMLDRAGRCREYEIKLALRAS